MIPYASEEEQLREWERARVQNEFEIDCAIQQYCEISRTEGWKPRRMLVTAANSGWRRFIERCRLWVLPDDTSGYIWLYKEDGWAFTAAIRFEMAAAKLAKETPDFYWSCYYLVSLLIERARHDRTFLEALEALTVAHLADSRVNYEGALDKAARMLQQMGVWPSPTRER